MTDTGKQFEPAMSRNNFDLLRLLFASTVCLVHSYELSGYKDLFWISQIFSSVVAVKAFFVVSGFFIFMSYERSTSLASYTGKRLRRIYPAYFFVILIFAIGLAATSTREISEYFSSTWLKYVAANLLFLNFLQPSLPGVFEGNPANAVNGALWTLKIEVMFYACVPVFVVLFRRFSHLPILLGTFILSVAFREFMTRLADQTGSNIYSELARQLPGQLAYFMAGAAAYYFFPFLKQHALKLFTGSVIALAIDGIYALPLIEPAALAIVVASAGLFCYLGNFGKYGDFSYGVYILHFPIIQLFIASGWFSDRPWTFLFCILATTLMAAIMLWNLIEKRFVSHHIRNISKYSMSPAPISP